VIWTEIGREGERGRGGAIKHLFKKETCFGRSRKIFSSRSDKKLTGVLWLCKLRDEGGGYTEARLDIKVTYSGNYSQIDIIFQ
jgi:hypothetical protein